jgi:hypothetical protein
VTIVPNGPCHHPRRMAMVDEMDVLVEWCPDCTRDWVYGKVSPERAEAVRRAGAAWVAERGGG